MTLKLSIIIPCYNEENTLRQIVNEVLKQIDLIKEIIIVDDNSSDSSKKIIEELAKEYSTIKYIFKDFNEGKGSAIIKGISIATGDIILIQDADVVYGSRFLGGDYVRLHFFWHYLANKILTFFCNIITNLNMSDMETGYKLIKKKHLDLIELKEKSFGIEPEITVKLAKKKLIFYEVPISYRGRSYSEGKKIGIKDAFVAVYCIVRYKFFN